MALHHSQPLLLFLDASFRASQLPPDPVQISSLLIYNLLTPRQASVCLVQFPSLCVKIIGPLLGLLGELVLPHLQLVLLFLDASFSESQLTSDPIQISSLFLDHLLTLRQVSVCLVQFPGFRVKVTGNLLGLFREMALPHLQLFLNLSELLRLAGDLVSLHCKALRLVRRPLAQRHNLAVPLAELAGVLGELLLEPLHNAANCAELLCPSFELAAAFGTLMPALLRQLLRLFQLAACLFRFGMLRLDIPLVLLNACPRLC
mmetsp:Transcript_17742/g.49001  ORF Transcript_17742/g.49001 Transcript_17742/m.49001 type:complete len:260 (-) Transcript_17742:407-1186(-)